MATSETISRLDEMRAKMSECTTSIPAVGTKAMSSIDEELVPIITELLMLGPGKDDHSSVRHMFNWLSNRKRTADEIIYVLAPLNRHVYKNMKKKNASHIYEEDSDFSVYLGKVAAEALAVHCPVLQGSWEHVTYFVLSYSEHYCSDDYGFASDRLSTWVIHVLGDPDLCPNPFLRTRLLQLFYTMCTINDENDALALKGVMKAFSHLNRTHIKEGWSALEPSAILKILKKITMTKYIIKFDMGIPGKLQDVCISHSSDILHDVSYRNRLNPSRYTGPGELDGLNALFKILSEFARFEAELLPKILLNLDHEELLEAIVDAMSTAIVLFLRSCQTSQLVDATALCIIDIVELVMLTMIQIANFDNAKGYIKILEKCEEPLQLFCNSGDNDVDSITTSPVGQIIMHKYQRRLSNLRDKLYEDFGYNAYMRSVFPCIHILGIIP